MNNRHVPSIRSEMHRVLSALMILSMLLGAVGMPIITVHAAPSETVNTNIQDHLALQTSFNCADVTEIPQAECEALEALYNSTNGASWTNNTDWLLTNTPCSWYGVACGGTIDEKHVVNISLPSNQLGGNIPSQLGNLTHLQGLYLSNNALIGNIPTELGNLSSLQYLDLYHNQLSGSLPATIGNLSFLNTMLLAYNQLSGSIPVEIGVLSNLRTLGLYGNQLSGSIPVEIGNALNLRDLELDHNQLTGSIPVEIGNLSNLQYLALSNNQISGIIPVEIGNLSNLQVLFLASNQLSGNIPAAIGNLSNLHDLDLSNNQLTGNIPPAIGNLTQLGYMTLMGNRLNGSIPPELGNLTQLQALGLERNELTGSLPSEMGSLTKLVYLYLDHNQLSGEFPVSITNLVILTSLSFDCTLTSTDPTVIAFLSSVVPGWPASCNRSISGNAGVGGTILSYWDGTVKTVTVDGSGDYSITLPYGWSGTVTPSRTGYTFSPNSKEYANVIVNLTGENYNATANTYPLGITKTGTGLGTVTSVPLGIDCGTNCSYDFSYNTVVTLTAVPAAGSTFAGWSGEGCTGTDTCAVTVDAAKSVTATFTELPPVCTGILYVDKDSTAASPNGCSWSWAFRTLQDALAVAPANGTTIWVAEGTYYPDEGAGQTNNNRDGSFNLKNGVSLYGGFAGTETALDQRNLLLHVTTLSGDIDQVTGNTNNSYHVVMGLNITSSILDGFTITGGNADGGDNYGGGIYLIDSHPTLKNLILNSNAGGNGGGLAGFSSNFTATDVVFTANTTRIHGAGMFIQDSAPTMSRVTFSANVSIGYGGGMASFSSAPVMTDVTFDGNQTTGDFNPGGGMYISDGSPVLNRVTFSNNRAQSAGGGGMYNYASNVQMTNVTFANNYAYRRGGAMANETSSPILNNVTFTGNTAALQASGGMANFTNSNPVIRNSILWGDTPQEIVNADATSVPQVVNSVVQGGCPAGSTCTNVLTTDPKLGVLANNGGFTQTITLGAASSAIDAGDNSTCATTDQRGNTRPLGLACDAGAYEAAALTALTLTPVTGEYNGTASITATLKYNGVGINGKTIFFTLNGSSVGTATTNTSGVATLHTVSLAGFEIGTHVNVVAASFAGDAAYSSSTATTDLTIGKATPVITWSNPADIIFGTALDSTQLNATASVLGIFVYTPSAGTVLNPGNGQVLSVNFTPEDAAHYNNTSATVTINVYACYTLTLGHTGQGTDPAAAPVSSTGCPAGKYRTGESIQLSGVTPVIGWHIAGWTGTSNDASTGSTNSLTMPASDHSVSVNYVQDEYTLDVVSAHGTVTKSPNQSTYHYGDEVTLSATPESGWTFSSWTPSLTDNKVVITGNTTVTANYNPVSTTLTIISDHGSVTKDPDKTSYAYGEVVQLTAVPVAGWHFDHWQGDLTGATNPTSLTMESNKTVTAIFVQDTVTHSIALVPGWNLVSFNVHPTNTSLSAVLASIAGNYDLVYAWDATGAHAYSGNWLKADNIPYSPDSLTTLDETMGFWVHMTSADTLDVVGTLPTTTSISLSTGAGGWNLVGYPSSVNRSLPGALSDHGVGTNYTLVFAYHASEAADPWKLYDRTTPPFANDLLTLAPGWGYWVKVGAGSTWSVDYVAP